MWPLSRRQRVRIDEFCSDFYDKNILKAVIRDQDLNVTACEIIKRSIAEFDPGFVSVETQKLCSQIKLIRFEVFGLAWMHQLGQKHAVAQSNFTKYYFEMKQQQSIWQQLESYNQAVARSSTYGYSPETPTGRAYLTFRNATLADFFDQWCARGFDATAVARAANRLCCDSAWAKGITAASLVMTLCEHLSHPVSAEAQLRLAYVVRGLYDGSREALKRIKVES